MSTSTVSITEANPAARRRPVVSAEKKTTSIELFVNNVCVSQSNASADGGGGGGGDEKVTFTGNGRDLGHHSIRGEAVLERYSKHVVQVKKAIGDSSVSPRRSRKVTSKPEKPWWLTVLSIFAKNLVLLVVLVGLVHLIRRLALESSDGVEGSQVSISKVESRIADVEALLKKTAKMIQVQVEVVDRKIEDEIGGLRKEVNNKIDDKGAILESGLKKLEAKSEGLERSLSEMKAMDWLSKEEFEKIYDDLRKVRGSKYGGASLDEIRAYAREMIDKEIEKHAADGLGRVDYALASGGAEVVKHSEPYVVGRGRSNWFLWSAKNVVHSNAKNMLKPSFGEPGHCFPLKGSSGFFQIRLRTAIVPEAVTLEHAAKSVAYDRSSAPRDCRVSGWLQGRNTDSALDTERMFLLAEFTYDLEKSSAQTFNVLDSAGSGVVDTIKLDFTSNHGSPSHTCIYRLRVHGREPDSISVMAMQS